MSLVPVAPLLAYTSPRVDTIAGRTIRLQCLILLGNPRPTITWVKMGERVITGGRVEDQGNGNLIIRDVQVEDEGEYTCVASNVGGNATHVTTLDVQGEYIYIYIYVIIICDMYDMVIEFCKLMALCSLQSPAFIFQQLIWARSQPMRNITYDLLAWSLLKLYSVSQLWKATCLVRLHDSVFAFYRFHCTIIFSSSTT